MMANNPAAIALSSLVGKNTEMLSPRNTPSALASSKAEAEPMNTYLGAAEFPLKLMVANWLLSPSSDKKIVLKLKNNNCQSIIFPINIFSKIQRFALSYSLPKD
jgi:hypothetical protein